MTTFRPISIILCLLLVAVPAFADSDVGHVALIEDSDGTILDGFAAQMPNVFLSNVSCKFYQSHPDAYDAIFVFNTAVTNMQQGWPVQLAAEGLGRGSWGSQTQSFCANQGRLRQAVNMGDIRTLPPNPDDIANIVLFYPLTGIELQAHEFGHQWLASVNFDKGDEQGTQCLLRGYEPTGSGDFPGNDQQGDCNGGNINDFNQHWSYYYNSCSLMYGSCIEDLGGGNFRFYYNDVKFSQLDQYLMGIRAPEEVDPMFLVWTGDLAGSASIPIQHSNPGVQKSGERIDVTIEDIIRENGPRVPASEACHWKAAFILVYPKDQPPSEFHINMVDAYRTRWEQFYDYATDNRGSFDTSLDGCGLGTETCPGEESPQCGMDPGVECTEGLRRCSGVAVVESCNGGEWRPVEDCEADEICENAQCVPIEADGDETVDGDEPVDGDDKVDGDQVCAALEKRCRDNLFERCRSDGSMWQTLADCSAESATCKAESGCVKAQGGDRCEPGEQRCTNNAFERCADDGLSYVILEDCSLNDLDCDAGQGCVESYTNASHGGCAQSAEPAYWLLLSGLLALLTLARKRRA